MSGLKNLNNWERMRRAGQYAENARHKTNHQLRDTLLDIALDQDRQDCADLLEAAQRLTTKPIVEAESIRRN